MSESNDEHQAKKSRKNDDETPIVETVVENEIETENSKNEETKEDGLAEHTCVLCMEEGTALNPLLDNHQCPQCATGAWKVCHVCNEALLSRLCPICRAEYAPTVMYTMPGLPFKSLADSSLNDEEKSSLLYKFGIVRQMVSKTNVCIWSPSKKRMYFSLPSKLIDNGSEATTYIITSIPMTETEATPDLFNFSNKVWDAIENEVETGAVQAGESVDYQKAAQHILNVTREDGHRLYTMLSPSDWDYMLNPNTSSDISDTLKSIRMTILHRVESVIPKNEESTEKHEDVHTSDKSG